MKPSAAKNATTKAATAAASDASPAASDAPPAASEAPPAASEAPPAAPGVTDELRAIDAAPLERLLEIRKEEAQLEEFRARAEQMKDKVQDVVWRRVVSDYTKRGAALEGQAMPLKVQVRSEYQKLRALFERTRTLNDSAELEKSELEFRHAVGELSKKQLEERLKGPTEVLDRCRTDLAAIDEQKARFLSAFASEAELDAPPPAPPPVPKKSGAAAAPPAAPAPAAAPAAAEPEPEPDVTVLAKNPLLEPEPDVTVLAKNPLAPPPSSPAAPPPPAIEPDVTSIVSAEQVAAMSAAAAKAAAAGESDDRTFMLPAAGLVVGSDGPAPTEYRLAAMNYLGRADDSHVVIARPGVSRKHALIMAGIGGFNIKDLESQNGTFVNGQRITEQPLKDGDQIVIGDTKILYRIPWPSGSQRAKA
jgi:hypothetical protein